MLAQTSRPRAERRERVIQAAIAWVYDQGCSGALTDLEEAVCNLVGRELDGSVRRNADDFMG